MRLSLPRRVALVGVVVASLLAPGALPAQAATTGTVSGRLTTSAGAPAADVGVRIYTPDFFGVDWTSTDSDGNWSVPGLAPGRYAVAFEPAEAAEQYYRQKTTPWDADTVTVTAGDTVTADDQLFATGTITGQIRDAAGAPVSDLLVEAVEVDTQVRAWARTEPDGRYRIGAFGGTYLISFRPIEGLWQTQYVPGKLDTEAAGRYTVTAGAELVVDETVLPTGSMSGTLTTAAGAPVADAYVAINTANMYGAVDANTDANGRFSVPALLAGTYKLAFYAGERQQFYRGKLDHQQADPVTVTGGQATTVDESLLGEGSVEISAVDSVTGASIADFCAVDKCSQGTGKVLLTGLPEGRHLISLYTRTGQYHHRELSDVRVVADRTTRLTPKMRPGAVITTTIVDRQTGAPVSGVCVAAFLPKQAALPDGYGRCSDSAGRINIGPLSTGTYKLFADPRDSPYGRQWVGADGGTGDERQAVPVATTVGTVVTGPQVKLDRAGRISGVVTDATSGQPVRQVDVSVLTGHPGLGVDDAITDDDGRYTLERLGPYAWPVVFAGHPYPQQWSGNAVSRFTATPVTVTTGGVSTYDMTVRAGSTVAGDVTDADGRPFVDGYVIARSADTGDIAGYSPVENGRYRTQVVGKQRIYFTYNARIDDTYHSGTYKELDAEGVLRVARFTVPASGTLTANLTISTS
ncbi:carboxypeptidase regulatory-like domain-containing protein [Micromonospora sp. WMMD882]|uniref:carboxypeptidase regulatory-like domain-containing protein n=1 Tax=Micromonospora sp. WMMD882 TaxID=3015151 RepID=UPI00248D08B6|nr:carboxypeptidase regulatory-like domain-containing protein [Micromonospora sp. WMMD882]WBB78412.1 carboxypeptidase regulatory-like domain-containing protein [Micromonospora sp. WMMD882]